MNVLDKATTVAETKYVHDKLQSEIDMIAGIVEVESWADVQKIVRAGLAAKFFSVGDQLTCQKDGVNLVWDIIDIDYDMPADPQYTHSMTLQLHDCFQTNLQYDAPEAFYYAENGLAAGTYYFTIDSSYEPARNTFKDTGYQFTLEHDVPAGGQLGLQWGQNTNASSMTVSSFASADSLPAQETVPVVSGTTGNFIGNLTTLGDTVNHLNLITRARYGNNRYQQSAIRQWLNSDKATGQVWAPQTEFDRAPNWASSTAGFLTGMDADFLAVVGATQVVTGKPSADGGGFDTTSDRFFLISRSQAYCGNETANVDEGAAYRYYAENSSLQNAGTGVDSNRIKYQGGSAQKWAMRTPGVTTGNIVRGIQADGSMGQWYYAYDGLGIAPACNIM